MKSLTINNQIMKSLKYFIILCFAFFISGTILAQEKEATMTITFDKVDSNDVCKVYISSEDKPVAEVSVKLYVQRLFGLLPIGSETATDEEGYATFEFPKDIPLNPEGKLKVIAKVEDDENYGSFEADTETNIGFKPNLEKLNQNERAIWGARDRAPIYFIVASLVIISGIWGTLLYVVLQLFKIKKNAHSV